MPTEQTLLDFSPVAALASSPSRGARSPRGAAAVSESAVVGGRWCPTEVNCADPSSQENWCGPPAPCPASPFRVAGAGGRCKVDPCRPPSPSPRIYQSPVHCCALFPPPENQQQKPPAFAPLLPRIAHTPPKTAALSTSQRRTRSVFVLTADDFIASYFPRRPIRWSSPLCSRRVFISSDAGEFSPSSLPLIPSRPLLPPGFNP